MLKLVMCGFGLFLLANHPSAPDPQKFAILQAVLQESPTMRAETARKCMERQVQAATADLETLAAFLMVGVADVPGLLCPRMVEALAAGRISHGDMKAIEAGQIEPSLLRRIVPLLQLPGASA